MSLNNVALYDWQLLAHLSQMFRSMSDSFADHVEMHRVQSIVLCTVCVKDGMTQTAIADQLALQGATVTNMLQRMEESGLVVRRRDLTDNRLVRVYVTDLGREKEKMIHEQFLDMQSVVFKDMSEDDRATLRRLLGQVIQNMSARG